MSVRFWTNNARGLLYAFEQAVHDGDISTWHQDANGLFTHASQHLKSKAFMRAKVYSDSLAFAILKADDVEMTDQLYGMYQACLIQSFLTHLSGRFTLADASSDFRDRDGDLGIIGFQQAGSRTPKAPSYSSLVQEIRAAQN